jgi:hypothetical protein
MQMIKELEEVRDAIVQYANPSFYDYGCWSAAEKAEEALATLDRIIKRDPAELVAAAIRDEWNAREKHCLPCYVNMKTHVQRDFADVAAKAALRAVGFMPEINEAKGEK